MRPVTSRLLRDEAYQRLREAILAGELAPGASVRVESLARELTGSGALVVSVRPAARERDRCPHCRRRCLAMTGERGNDAGGRWTSAPHWRISRPTRRGSAASITA